MDWFGSLTSKKRSSSPSNDRKTRLVDEDHHAAAYQQQHEGDEPSAHSGESSSSSEFEMVEPRIVPPNALSLNDSEEDDEKQPVPPPLDTCDTARELEAAKRQASEIYITQKESEQEQLRIERQESERSKQPVDEGFFAFFFGGFSQSIETAADAVLRRTTQYPPPGTDPLSTCLHDYPVDDNGDEIPTKVPLTDQNLGGRLQRAGAFLLSQGCIYSTIFAVMALGLILGMAKQLNLLPSIDWDEDMNVAFIGNSYLVVNDIPRILETMSEGHVDQNSCLHAGGSLATILSTGNGMYDRWMTNEALFTIRNDDGGYQDFWDWGFCSVPQLLTGSDEDLEYGNFYDDGKNPCLKGQGYLQFLEANIDDDLSWDYVVLADQSKRMAISDARQVSIDALVGTYAPLLQESGAVPVFVDTHAFWSDNSNMTGLTDVPTFQSMIYEGVQEYMEALADELPRRQRPLLAPVGLAFLTVYEEDYDLWEKLFLNDAIHSSIYGSYLFGCVLYCTLFGHLPQKDFKRNPNIEFLFSNSRKLTGQASYPSFDEAVYLRRVARRVALRGYKPKSLSY